MAIPAAAVGVGLAAGVVGGAMSFFGREEQARRIRAQANEADRRMKAQQEQQLGLTTAAAGASGYEIQDSSGLQQHLSAMSQEFTRQRDFAMRAARQQASDVTGAAGFGLLSDLGGSLFKFGQANNWWRSSPAVAPVGEWKPSWSGSGQ